MLFQESLKKLWSRPLVRPWALASPILILLVCLPLLRPLRHPETFRISDSEASRLATVQAIVEHKTLAIDETSFTDTHDKIYVGGRSYSDQPPVFSVLLSGSYWMLHRLGFSLERNPVLVTYLLTVIGVTLPVALSAGIVYRMSRLFELRRPWRALLASAAVFGSGLVAYGVVLNAHAPAAAAVLAAVACLIHVATSHRPLRSSGWLFVGGLCVAAAATMDPPAAVFPGLLLFAIMAMRWPLAGRVGGLALFVLGMAPFILLHAALTVPLTGDILPPVMHQELARVPATPPRRIELSQTPPPSAIQRLEDEPDPAETASWFLSFTHNTGRLLLALIGPHGVFSHFPVMIVGILGVLAVMHRHWPATTKVLAVATLVGSAIIVATCALWRVDWAHAMFGARWFIVFLPLVLFWSGAWLRRRHHPAMWAFAGLLLAFSVAASLLGATNPFPREGYGGYTVAGAVQDLIHVPAQVSPRPVLAGGIGSIPSKIP